MKILRVSLKERSYPVVIGSGLLAHTGNWIKKAGVRERDAIIVSQAAVAAHYLNPLTEALSRDGFNPSVFLTPRAKSSEAAKSQAVFLKLIHRIAQSDGQKRSVFLIALGGGVIGDLTGFAAAVYRRGIPYVQIPTTLTAQVDSAIGGKTGIDLAQGKNLMGSIYQPRLVLSDRDLLRTLPERHWSDGFAEVIKYGVIKDPGLFSMLEKHGKEGIVQNTGRLEKALVRSAHIKARIVEKDEWDKKEIRIALNFGHTAGHAIEAASKFSNRYTHGEAVAVGMLIACELARSLGILKEESLLPRLEQTLVKFSLPIFYKGATVESLMRAIGYDKKNVAAANCFVLPVRLGQTVIVRNISQQAIEEALKSRKS